MPHNLEPPHTAMQNSVKRQSYKSASKSVPKSALILGAGYTARSFIPHLQARSYEVSATRRAKPIGIQGVNEIDFTQGLTPKLAKAFETADVILNSVPPYKPTPNNITPHFADPVLASLSQLTPKKRAWIGYLSATSVYGDMGGALANEDSPVNPSLRRGKARANAEIAWIETAWPVHIFRLAGIYGPDMNGVTRNPFGRLAAGTARAVVKNGHVVNRIHVDDICSALLKSIDAPNPQRIYNIADGNPSAPQDVLYYAAELIGAPRPKTVSVDSPEITAMARTFYAETKRIDISRAQTELGWTPKYPNYQAGLQAILKHRAP